MISIARIFGAPESVPAGSVEPSASKQVLSLLNLPSTSVIMCITCEKRSTYLNRVTFTEPNSLTLPISFLPKSTSIVCSAISFLSAKSSFSSAISSSTVLPLGRVPAIGPV